MSSTGTLSSKSFYLEGERHSFHNEGTINIGNWMNVKGYYENRNQFTVNGLNIDKKGTLENTGTILNDSEMNVSGQVTNYGEINIQNDSKNLNLKKDGVLLNHCTFKIGKNFNMSEGHVTNNGYLRVNGWFYGNKNTEFILGHQSMISVGNFQPDGKMVCEEGYAAIKVDEKTNIDSNTEFVGTIDICDESGIDNIWTRDGELPKNISFCEVYIPAGSCNPEGVGTPAVQDADNDGIVDDEDHFPTDPNRAFSFSDPYSGIKVWAFEDLWPSTGDYDFNDIVIATRCELVYNSEMKPVEAEVEVQIRALGASINQGVGLQFLSDQLPSDNIVKSVAGDYSSLDKAKHSVIISQNVNSDLSPKYNNNGKGPRGNPQTFSCKIQFNTDAAEAGVISPDFFIFRSADRSHEIHVANTPATEAVNTSLFGTAQDATQASEDFWYKTYNGIPWGFTLVMEDRHWNHPTEKTAITEAYPGFSKWAMTGGDSEEEWYLKGIYEKCFHD